MSGNRESPKLGYQPWNSLYRDEWTADLCRVIWREANGEEMPEELLREFLQNENLMPPQWQPPESADADRGRQVMTVFPSGGFRQETRANVSERRTRFADVSFYRQASGTSQRKCNPNGLASDQSRPSSSDCDTDLLQLERRDSWQWDTTARDEPASQSDVSAVVSSKSWPLVKADQPNDSSEVSDKHPTTWVAGNTKAVTDSKTTLIAKDVKHDKESKDSVIATNKAENVELLSLSVRNTAGAQTGRKVPRLTFLEDHKQDGKATEDESATKEKVAEKRKRKPEPEVLPGEDLSDVKKMKVELVLPKRLPQKLVVRKTNPSSGQRLPLRVKDIAHDMGTDMIDEMDVDSEVDFYMRSGGPHSVEMIRGVPFQYELPSTSAYAAVSNTMRPQQYNGSAATKYGVPIVGTPYPDAHNTSHPVTQHPLSDVIVTDHQMSQAATGRESPFFILGENGEMISYGDPPRLTTEHSDSAIRLLNPWPSSRRYTPKFQPITVVGGIDTDASPAFWTRSRGHDETSGPQN